MAIGDVRFIKGQGGLGRELPGQDHYSGMLFFGSTLPSGFSSSDRIKQIFSLEEAEDLGILLDYSDETKATGTYTSTTVGADGDTLELKVAEPRGIVSLGVHEKTSAETTTTLQATAIAATINAGTLTHGYTASANLAIVTITARPGLGVYLNAATKLTKVTTGTLAGTIADFSGGVASFLMVMWYHIACYFLKNPQGVLWVGIYAEAVTFAEIQTIQNFADGGIRRMGVYVKHTAFSTAHCNSIQSIVAACDADHKPLSVIYTGDLSATALIGSFGTLAGLSDNKVTVDCAQDGFALGFQIFKALGKSLGSMGAALGTASLGKVNESIGWVGKFNQVIALNGESEFDVVAFSNGQNYKDVTSGQVDALDAKRYVFMIKRVGKTGSFYNAGHCAVALTSDYAYMEDNTTIDKAIRGIYATLVDELNGSTIDILAGGVIAPSSVAYFESRAEITLNQMVRDGELSDNPQNKATVDPSQNVVSTGKLVIAVTLVQKGIARTIEVPISYTNPAL